MKRSVCKERVETAEHSKEEGGRGREMHEREETRYRLRI